MVNELSDSGPDDACWVLRPTRSMTWPQAKRLLALIALVSAAIGGLFLLQGFPLIMPFSGLEVLAVTIAFYVVLRDGERREVVRLRGDRLFIERGMRVKHDSIEFNRFWVQVELLRSRYRYHPSRLLVASHGRRVELGRFLTEAERASFARTLINALRKNR